MINVSDLVMNLDSPMSWPSARRWLIENYGDNSYIPMEFDYHYGDLEPEAPEFEERWALLTVTHRHPGYHQTFFYLDFQDPDDELVFRLKWL